MTVKVLMQRNFLCGDEVDEDKAEEYCPGSSAPFFRIFVKWLWSFLIGLPSGLLTEIRKLVLGEKDEPDLQGGGVWGAHLVFQKNKK